MIEYTTEETSMTRDAAKDLLDNLIGMVEDNHGADYDSALRMGVDALDKCDKIAKIIGSYDADFIANYVRGLFKV